MCSIKKIAMKKADGKRPKEEDGERSKKAKVAKKGD